MTGAEILALVAKAVLSGAISTVAKRGVDGIADWVAEQRAAAGQQFTDADRALLKALLSDRESFVDAVLAQFKTVRRAGVAIIGPSGAGKSTLFNYLRGKAVIQPHASTAERDSRTARFRSRQVTVIDTPGSPYHVDFRSETLSPIQSKPISVLVVMVAYGYLDTMDYIELRRPGRHAPFESREEYIKAARQEEIEWLLEFAKRAARPRRPIPYCMVVINKMDQWLAEHADAVNYYQAPPALDAIGAVVSKLCLSGVARLRFTRWHVPITISKDKRPLVKCLPRPAF